MLRDLFGLLAGIALLVWIAIEPRVVGRSRAWRRLHAACPEPSAKRVVWMPGAFWLGRSAVFRTWRFASADAEGLTLSILPEVPNRFGAVLLRWREVDSARTGTWWGSYVTFRPQAVPDIQVSVRARHLAKLRAAAGLT